MSTNFQNMYGPAVPPMVLGRIIRRIENWVAPFTKRVYQLRWIQETLDQNGIFVTNEFTEISPETDDGTIPDTVKQLRECPCCYKVITKTSYCQDCRKEFSFSCVDKENRCRRCAAKAKNPILFRIHSNLWGD
jgi:hypothetical protein